MQKRGQVTAFILIGLVLLIVVFGVVAIQQGYFNSALKKLGLIRATPAEINPVEDFLSGCVKSISLDGINLISLQGGYATLPNDPIPNSQFTPVGNVLDIIPGSDLRTSLWFRERGNGIQVLDVPSKNKLEEELENYVNNNFQKCINNLSSFSEQGYEVEGNNIPNSNAVISNKKIRVDINFPLTVRKNEAEFKLEKHSAEIDSNLGELYNFATEIIKSQNENKFFEEQTINMLVAYDPEIPYSGIDIGCTEKTWYKPDAVLKLKNILNENIAAMSVKGTKRENAAEYLELDSGKGTHKDIDVNFMYLANWPTLVEITPSEGNILRGNSVYKKTGNSAVALLASFACIGDHRFVYDIKYPVLITLRDENGLLFQFATEVIIDNNQARTNKLELTTAPEIDNEICKYPQKKIKITTGTYDGQGEVIPLSDVDLSFKCSPASCDLGKSTDDFNLATYLPLCFNGIVEGRKEGYFAGKTIYSSNEENNNEVLVTLEPLYKKKINLKIIEKETGEVREPYESEQISFQFNHKTLTYASNYIYPDQDEIELIVGDYNVNSYVIREPTWKLTTQKQTVEKCVDTRDSGLIGFFKTKQHCEKLEVPSVELERVLTGGAKFEHSFTREELSSDKELILYVLADQIPGDLEKMQEIQTSIETNKDNKLFRYPEI